jgi:hypothetical protein
MTKMRSTLWGSIEEGHRTLSIGDVEMEFNVTGDSCEYRVISEKNVVGLRRVWMSADYDMLLVRPATPDLPIVLKPEVPICLVPGASVYYEARVPVWIQLVGKRSRSRKNTAEEILEELPSRKMRRYWFGSVDQGEVAYALRFAPAVQQRSQRHHLIVPLNVRNASQMPLWFQRFIVRVVHLDVFSDGKRVFTNDVRVVFKGPEQLSQITFGDSSSLAGDNTEQLSARRIPTNNDIIRKSFMLLRDLTG